MTQKLIESLIQQISPPNTPRAVDPHHDIPSRRYITNHPVITDDLLQRVLSAARFAPSANNAQEWRFVTVVQSETLRQLAKILDCSFGTDLEKCSASLVICGKSALIKRIRREQPFVFIDVPIALTHILLRLAEMRLPHCWTASLVPDQEKDVQDLLQIPSDVRIVAIVGVG